MGMNYSTLRGVASRGPFVVYRSCWNIRASTK